MTTSRRSARWKLEDVTRLMDFLKSTTTKLIGHHASLVLLEVIFHYLCKSKLPSSHCWGERTTLDDLLLERPPKNHPQTALLRCFDRGASGGVQGRSEEVVGGWTTACWIVDLTFAPKGSCSPPWRPDPPKPSKSYYVFEDPDS